MALGPAREGALRPCPRLGVRVVAEIAEALFEMGAGDIFVEGESVPRSIADGDVAVY